MLPFSLHVPDLSFAKRRDIAAFVATFQERLITFWSRFGFRLKQKSKKFIFSDFEYVEIVADIESDPLAITIDAEPYVLIRPEGRWDVPGVLERSAERAASQDPVVKKPRHGHAVPVVGRQH